MNKAVKITLGIFVAVILLAGAFSGGFIVGTASPMFIKAQPTDSLPSAQPQLPLLNSSVSPQTEALFQPFWETWNLVHERYVDQPVDDVALMRGAVNGMLATLNDKHTSYMDPDEYKQANSSLSGEYEGIGAYVETSGEYLTVISPIPGSPAEAAGIRSGDQIIALDGKDMTGTAPDLVRKQVLGPAGSVVTLTIKRGEENPFDVKITRSKITIKSAEGKMLDNGIAYVQVNTFGDNTTKELTDTLTTLMAQHPKGMILDLRDNGGGYLETAIEVASQFLPADQVILHERYGSGKQQDYTTLGGGLATDIPMVVLINEGSASASEILAGALQDYGRAKLVGVVSYGKGSVQVWTPLSNGQGAVRVTIAKWYTPNGRTIHEVGLTPDVYVSMTENDYKNKLDPQLDAAIQTLLAMLNGNPVPTSMPTVTPMATP